MHFKDEERRKVYRNILKTLKPGGKLLVSDYCRGEKPSPREFLDYEKQRGYNLWTVKKYGEMLEQTGFQNVKALDKTDRMVEIMKMELKKFYGMKDSFVKKYSQKDFNDLDEVGCLVNISNKECLIFFCAGLEREAGVVSWRSNGMGSLYGH